jgi:hypothetical protein
MSVTSLPGLAATRSVDRAGFGPSVPTLIKQGRPSSTDGGLIRGRACHPTSRHQVTTAFPPRPDLDTDFADSIAADLGTFPTALAK